MFEEVFKSFVNKMLKIRCLDRKIILELIRDARQPILHIAKSVNASRQTVSKKIDKYLSSGLITGFAPKLDPEKFGLTIKTYILMREDPGNESRSKNEEAIKRFHQVSKFHRLFGKYSGIMEVLVKDKNELADLVRSLHKLRGVKETETLIVYNTVKDEAEDPFKNVLTFEGDLSKTN